MKFKFSATIDEVNCHIRSFGNQLKLNETVDERPHKHYFMEFHCIFEGEETIHLPGEDRQLRLLPGQILLLPQGVYHGVATKKGTVERICFNFSADAPEGVSSPFLEQYRAIREPVVLNDPDAVSFVRQCRRFRRENAGPMADMQQGMLLLNAVLRLFSLLPGKHSQPSDAQSRIQRQKWTIEEYIEQHFTDPDGIAGLADELHLSEKQTSKLVKKFLGEDYKSIIIRRRMELAEIYLRDPEKSLEEIAWQVGYRSYSGFQLCFKQYFGISPSHKRQQLLQAQHTE